MFYCKIFRLELKSSGSGGGGPWGGGGEGGGGGTWQDGLENGGDVGVDCVQHSPIQMFLGLSLDVFNLDDLVWSHPLHFEQSTVVLVTCIEQTGQN